MLVVVPEAERGADPTSPWFLFNDFVVDNISEDEALSFPDRWKVGGGLFFWDKKLILVNVFP